MIVLLLNFNAAIAQDKSPIDVNNKFDRGYAETCLDKCGEPNLSGKEPLIDRDLMSLTLADWFVIHVKVFSFFMITWITTSRPNGLDSHG